MYVYSSYTDTNTEYSAVECNSCAVVQKQGLFTHTCSEIY